MKATALRCPAPPPGRIAAGAHAGLLHRQERVEQARSGGRPTGALPDPHGLSCGARAGRSGPQRTALWPTHRHPAPDAVHGGRGQRVLRPSRAGRPVRGLRHLGGYPLHLDAWDFGADASSNRLRLAGSPGGVLLEDAWLLMATLPEGHWRALIAVGQGRARRSEIQNEVGGRVDLSLEGLTGARLCAQQRRSAPRSKPDPSTASRTPTCASWFRCLSNGVQRIEAGQGAAVLQHTAEQWQNHLGWVFEQAAGDHAGPPPRSLSTTRPPGRRQGVRHVLRGGRLGLLDHRTAFVGEAKCSRQPLS